MKKRIQITQGLVQDYWEGKLTSVLSGLTRSTFLPIQNHEWGKSQNVSSFMLLVTKHTYLHQTKGEYTLPLSTGAGIK